MKKIIFILLFMAFCSVYAEASPTDLCTQGCVAPYNLTSKTSRFFSTVTGQNFLAEKIGAKLIKKAVKKNITAGDIKTNLKSYSVRDLKAGKFKSIEISGKNVNVQGVYITSFVAKTLCDFNYIVYDKDGNIQIKENVPISLNAEISEEDLNKTMNSSDYKRVINDINETFGGFFEIETTNIKLKNGKMYYVLKYTLPFVRKSKNIVFVSDLSVKNGKIALENTNFATSGSNFDINKISKLLNYINPLDFSAKILENKDAKFNIQNVTVESGKILISAQMTILKDKE